MSNSRKDTTPRKWRVLRAAFSRIARKTPRVPLWAIEDPATHAWKYNGGDRSLLYDFRIQAITAGITLGCPKDNGAVDFWLDQLYDWLAKADRNRAVVRSASMPGAAPSSRNPDELKVTEGKKVRVIRRVNEESAAFCADLQAQALERGMRQAPSRAEESPQLSDRENRIWTVICQKARGRQYCRELDNAGVATPRSGVWQEGPRKYVAAYDLKEPWRHRIQDEKSKIRHKAEA